MTISGWCEHCRDHFDEDHYDDEGDHRSGLEYGPLGEQILLERCVRAGEVAHVGETGVLLYVHVPTALWERISADGT